MDPQSQLIQRIASGATLSATLLGAVPAFRGLLAGRPEKPEPIYKDEDGISTLEETANFSNTVPKTLAVVFAAVGCFSSIFMSVLDTMSGSHVPSMLLDSWLFTSAWVRHPLW